MTIAGICCAVLVATGARAQEAPLHERVDRLIEESLSGRVAPAATDGEFLRRASLDLTGMIPTADEARAFLDDPSPYKRSRLIDRLLDSPEFARRMAVIFDLTLMERRPDAHVTSAEWRDYLYRSFLANKPYDQLAQEILAADGRDVEHRAPAKFFLDRQAESHTLTRDVGRIFLGRDIQCSQCHDHVLYDDYLQSHYYGLFAFVSRSYLVQDGKGPMVLGEKGEGDVTYASVFKRKVTNTAVPQVLDGEKAEEPPVVKGEEYLIPPLDQVPAVPRVSRRAGLAEQIVHGAPEDFGRNIANRLWALLMGRGLVHPLDLHHGDNPPSHPEVLEELTGAFAASKYDVKALIRELALTRAYARTSELPPGALAEDGESTRYFVANLKPLSPEQLAWSLMQGAGIVSAHRAEVRQVRLVSDKRLKSALDDPKRAQLIPSMVESEVYERLQGNAAPFIQRFGGPVGQTQDQSESTVHQALFLANGEPIQSWIGATTSRLAAIADPGALADELYLALLARRPVPEERDEVAQALSAAGEDRTGAIRALVWSTVTSTEFRYNH